MTSGTILLAVVGWVGGLVGLVGWFGGLGGWGGWDWGVVHHGDARGL